jgi:hypothetical protein
MMLDPGSPAFQGTTKNISFTVRVMANDTEPPSITCPANIVKSADPGQCSTVVNYTVTASDDCPGAVTVVCNPPSGSTFPKGTTTVTCTATDVAGNSSTCSFTVTVNDVEPPTITGVSVDRPVLWPPNHKLVNVAVNYKVTDNCPLSANSCTLSVKSNESINGTGDGNTSLDWIILDAHHVQLRAERAGNGNGRIYTVTITCVDSGGNSSSRSVTVSVPHDRGRH